VISFTSAESPDVRLMKSREIHAALRYLCLGRFAATARGRKCCHAKKGEEMLLRAYPGSEMGFFGGGRGRGNKERYCCCNVAQAVP